MIEKEGQNGGRNCIGEITREMPCNTNSCPGMALAINSIKNHVFLFQWTANGTNGADGHLARRHVEGELGFQQGGLRNKHIKAEATVWGR